MFNCHIYGKKPSVIQYLNQIKQDSYHANISQDEDANKRDLTWVLTRLLPTKLFEVELEPMTANQQKIPSWSAFNTMVYCRAPSTTEVRYFPMINCTSTDYNTVYTVMKQVQQMMSSLGQEYSVVTFDLAIYTKTKEIQWRHPEEFDDTVIRMGQFHIALNYFAVIGKMFRDSGLLDLIIESDIYGCSTASHLLQGKTYNRGVRCHKLVMESCQVVVDDMKEVRSQLVCKNVFAHVTLTDYPVQRPAHVWQMTINLKTHIKIPRTTQLVAMMMKMKIPRKFE